MSKIEKILENRQETYGDAEPNLKKIGRIWGALLGLAGDIPAYQVALMMDSFKTVRCFANPEHEDSWNDKLGYIHHAREIVLGE
jgi:hypothetical protein